MRRGISILAVLVLCAASAAFAQRSTATSTYASTDHKAEIIPLGGYAWTMSMDVYGYTTVAEIDLDDAAFWGVALDFNISQPYQKTAQLRLLYRREDSDVRFRSVSVNVSEEAAVEYWHIGGLGGVQRGKAMPFTTISLGGTRLVSGTDDEWKFSMIFGLGVKVYTSPKVGLMIEGSWPITFTDSWGGVTVGTGGAGVAIGGTGISQLDVGGGLIISF
jgi:hypothetical protein